ncbi:MAG: flavin-containing monooxygenase [Gammaproteobacteria bacterium]
MRTVKTIAIIGAGAAGLTTAKTLLARGYSCTVFERGQTLGGVWAAGYSNFGLQVQRELYEYPDFPHLPDTPDFTPGEQVQQYLERYARQFEVWPNIRFGTSIVNVRKAPNDADWVLTVEHDGTREEHFDFVVVCTGLFSNKPHMPSFPGQEDFEGQIIHVSALTDREQLANKRVAVVGFGKSATDAALESAAVASKTCLIFREVHWPVPPKLLEILPFKWAMLNRLTSALIPPYYRPSTLERSLHTLGKPLVWFWWRLVELLLIAQFGLGSRGNTRLSLIPRLPIEFDAFGEAVMLPRPAFYGGIRNGAIEPLMTEIAGFNGRQVVLKSGEVREIDVVILATGWETDYGYLEEYLRDALEFADDGLYLYRQMLHPRIEGLAFVGYASTIASVLTYSLQARWLADVLDGKHVLPAKESMQEDIALQRAWKRQSMPFSRGRAARLLLHMLHYHDDLLVDLRVSPLRKKGWLAPFKEVFAPYEPRDYREVVD